MSSINFTKTELSAALARGVRQCVVIGSRAFESFSDQDLRIFSVDASEPLPSALEKSSFDKQQPGLFVWLGDAGYRTIDAAISTLAFIASLPKGSGVVFDYAVERTALGSLTYTALDALASRISTASGNVKYLIQPQAVAGLLRGLGFQNITDLPPEELTPNGEHLVTALV